MQEQTPYTADFNLTGEFNIHAILDVLRTKWHWFVLSTVFCLGIAYIYVKTVPVVYKREAIVQLKTRREQKRLLMKSRCLMIIIISMERF